VGRHRVRTRRLRRPPAPDAAHDPAGQRRTRLLDDHRADDPDPALREQEQREQAGKADEEAQEYHGPRAEDRPDTAEAGGHVPVMEPTEAEAAEAEAGEHLDDAADEGRAQRPHPAASASPRLARSGMR